LALSVPQKKHWPPARRELTVDTLQQRTIPQLQYGAKVRLRDRKKRVRRERREEKRREKLS
jgi:hypothetical protein